VNDRPQEHPKRTDLTASLDPVEAPSLTMLDEVLRELKSGKARDWKDTPEESPKGAHVLSQRDLNASTDDRKVLQEFTIHDPNEKVESHVSWNKQLYGPNGGLIGWDAANYRDNGNLQATMQWRTEGTDPKTGGHVPNRYHSIDYGKDGKTKIKEAFVEGPRRIDTTYEADGKTPKTIETFVETEPEKYKTVGNRTVEKFDNGKLAERTTSEGKLSGRDELKLLERFKQGVLLDKGYPVTDADGREAWRRELYQDGKLYAFEDSAKTVDGKQVLLAITNIKDGHATDQLKYNYSVPRPDKAWYQSDTMPLDASMKEIPAGATVPSYTRIKLDQSNNKVESTRQRSEDGSGKVIDAARISIGRPVQEEVFLKSSGTKLSSKNIQYDGAGQPVITRAWVKSR
jgi:hypothetical protein